jgi:cysteine-rich repeat protein
MTGSGGARARRREAMIFAPLVLLSSLLACSGSGSQSDKPAGVAPGSSGGKGGASNASGGSAGSAARSSGGASGKGTTGEAGEGSGASASGAGRGGGSGAAGGNGPSGGSGNEAGAGDTGNEAGAPSVPLGPEQCGDGGDNDGDGDADCADAECTEACATLCGDVDVLEDPTIQPGSNVGHPAMSANLCGSPVEGPAVVYSVTAEKTGRLEASVIGSGLLRVAIRSTCAGPDAIACGFGRASADVRAGEELFVVVQGVERMDAGSFTLNVLSRTLDVCGDGFRDPSEGCDDEDREPGDGCDASCQVESKETEENGTLATEDAYVDPFYAAIDPEDDVDSVGFDLATRASVVVGTENLGEGSCAFGTLDSFLELFDENGDLLATDDDGGEGYCARIVLPNLPVGHYSARVTASAAGDTPTFPYRLLVFTDICGNGKKTLAEECDDANVANGDGCSASCQVE